jgi:hypothetical protein
MNKIKQFYNIEKLSTSFYRSPAVRIKTEEKWNAITRLVIGTSRTVGPAKKFVRITSCFGGGEFTKTLRKVCTCQIF